MTGVGRATWDRVPVRLGIVLRRFRTWGWEAADEGRTATAGAWHRRPRSRPGDASSGRVLVMDVALPDGTRDAGAWTMVGFMRILREEGHEVTFLAHDGQVPAAPAAQLRELGIALDDAGLGVLGWLAKHGANVRWVIVARPDIAHRHLHRFRRWTAAPVLYYTHDLHFLREERRAEVTGSADASARAQRFRAVETIVLRSVDTVLTPSTAELPVIEALVPGCDVRITVPFVDVPADMPDAGTDGAERRDLLFVGSFTHEPNVDAAEVLLADVMPRVWAREPRARVVVVGQHPPERIRAFADERVEVTGHVPDLGPYWARARALVAPIRYGAGVKGKLLSSLAAGVPVITTPVGNEGIDLTHDVDALIGASPERIAEHVVRILSDDELAWRLAGEGRRFVRRRFSEAVTRAQLRAALER